MAAMTDVSDAWLTCTSRISRNAQVTPSAWNRAISVLLEGDMGQSLSLWTVRLFEARIKTLSKKLLEITSESNVSKFRDFVAAVHKEFQDMRSFLQDLVGQLGPHGRGVVRRFLLTSRSLFESEITSKLPTTLHLALGKIAGSRETNPINPSALMDGVDESRTLCAQLVDLGLSRAVEDTVTWVVFETIDVLVKERTEGRLQGRALPTLCERVENVILPWIVAVLPHPSISTNIFSVRDEKVGMEVDTDHAREKHLQQWRKRLSFHLHNSVGAIRLKQILLMIDRFPESLPALEDLKDCLRSTDLKPEVTISLRKQFAEKMLNAGIVTSEILKQYVNMIRALRFLDPSDFVLESVSDVIHEYLRRRPDTIRCIVSDMTGDGELYQELERGRAKRSSEEENDGELEEIHGLGRTSWEQDDDDLLSIDGDLDTNLRIDFEAYNNWEPEPIDAPTRDGKWRSGGDAITTLVAIYGSSEQIVNEYKGLLADKLSTQLEVDIERETRVLQLLTERFGRDTMHDCDIMLKDFTDSAEIESELSPEVRGQLESFGTTVISKEFWPKLVDEPSFALMAELKRQVDLFEESYKKLKEPRTLRWEQSLGAVSVKLEFEDGRETQVTVSPIQATILHHFAAQPRLSVKDLQKLLDTDDENFVRRKVQSLASQGLLRAADNTNSIFETVEHGGDVDAVAADPVDDAPEGGRGDDAQSGGEEAEMAVYKTYIMAMLQNLKQLPLEQIHTMLQRFVQTPVYDKTQAQLAAFLSHLVDEGKIEISAGMYRIQSKPKS